VARTQRDGISILAVAASHEEEVFQTLPLGPEVAAPPQGWLVALCHDQEGRLVPAAGGLRRQSPEGSWELDLPCGPGAPVLSGDEVLGIVVRTRGNTASVGLPLAALRRLSQGLAAKMPTELLPQHEQREGGTGVAPPAGE
jgi:hypothetical protein